MAEETKPSERLSDPCQVPVKTDGKMVPCGAIKRSLYGHLKVHKKGDKNWTAAEYAKRFPSSFMGEKYQPPPEQIANLSKAPSRQNSVPKPEEQPFSPPSDYEERLQARHVEIFDQVGRDTSMKAFALEAARCEMRLQDLNAEYDELALKKTRDIKADAPRMNLLLDQIGAQQKMLRENMTFLGQSAKDRREKNQLGSDTPAQLISNFAGMRRRLSPERRAILDERARAVQATYRLRVREKNYADLGSGPEAELDEVPADDTDVKRRLIDGINKIR